MKILAILIVSFILGCATTLTEEEAAICKGNVTCLTEALDQKTYQAKYDAENKRILRREHIVAEIQKCLDSGSIIVESRRGGSGNMRPLIDKHGVIQLPKNAYIGDYYCATSGHIADSFKRVGLL